jgi:cell division protein FtsA
LTVLDVVLAPLASAEAVLTEDEKKLGVVLLDMGGGTSNILVFHAGSLVHTCVIPLGGDHITQDIAVGLRTPLEHACELKEKHGCAIAKMVRRDEKVEVWGVGGRGGQVIARQTLCSVIESRVEETMLLVQQELVRSGYQNRLAGGVVLTGGAALLTGMVQLTEEVLGLPVRLGNVSRVGGWVETIQSPAYATGVGLVLCGKNHVSERFFKVRAHNPYTSMGQKMRTWLGELF